MDEIHRIVMETPDSSDGSWEYSSSDDSSAEEAENETAVDESAEEPRAATSQARANRDGQTAGR